MTNDRATALPDRTRGTLEMTAAMAISGTIGWFVVRAGQPLADLLFWRCVFGAATLLAACAALGLLRGGRGAWAAETWPALGLQGGDGKAQNEAGVGPRRGFATRPAPPCRPNPSGRGGQRRHAALPPRGVAGHTASAAPCLAPLSAPARPTLLPPRLLGWRRAGTAALAGAALVANWVLIFTSFSHTSISVATAVYHTQPFMLVLLGAAFLGERLTAARLGWLALAFGGVVLVAQAKAGGAAAHGAAGVLMALGAAFCYAVAALLTKRLTGTPPHLVALVQVAVSALLVAPFANLAQLPRDAGTWATLAVMGVVYTGLVYILLYGAIQKLPTALTGALSFIYPVVAIAVDYVAFGQRLQPAQWAGAAAILVAAAAMARGGRGAA